MGIMRFLSFAYKSEVFSKVDGDNVTFLGEQERFSYSYLSSKIENWDNLT
jgi:hypothetical protein